MNEELDLRVLKGIVNDKVNALTFVYRYDHTLFDEEIQRFAKLVLDYTKHFRSPPTRRTLLDRHDGNSNLTQLINDSWDELDSLEYDIKEYAYDVSELKHRFQVRGVEEVRAQAASEDVDNLSDPEGYFNKLALAINRITSLELERSHIQKPVGDYVDEFAEGYESRRLNPESCPEIKTGFSMIDAVTGGVAPSELIMVGAETNGGKALSIYTPIPTPSGWTTMGKIKVGDLVFGDDGNACKVIAVSGVMYNRPCYTIKFSDGEMVVADAGHQWVVRRHEDKEVLTTEELFKSSENFWVASDLKEIEITHIEKAISVPVQCIQVDAASNCFLCGWGRVRTHNSMLLNGFGKQIWLQENTIDTSPDSFTRGYNVLYFSLEMPYQDCFIRFLASLANVPQRALAKSTLMQEEMRRVNKAYEFIKKYQENGYYFDIVDVPRNLTIEELELRYHDALLRYHPDVVIVDYMGLMNSKLFAKEQDWLKMGAIAASLHEFARAYDCVVITAAQLTDLKRSSQGSQEESRRVGVHRWGRSSLIMHHVNTGIQIETRQNEINFPDLKIHVVKNRKGPLGEGALIKNFANASLVDVPFDQRELPGDVSSKIPALIKSIQEAKNKSRDVP